MSEITEFLSKNFHKHPQFPNREFYCSWSDPDDVFGTGCRNLSVCQGKDLASIQILYFGEYQPLREGKVQTNIKIELFLMTQYEWETFFEGYVPDLETLKIIFNCIGIQYID